VLKKHPTPLKVDNWGVRFPTLVDDVSRCLKGLLDAKRADKAALTGIFHCSSPERATKYEQALLMADVLGVPASHLSPDGDPPPGAPRPQNTQLDCSGLWAALGTRVEFTPLREGFAKALAPFKREFAASAGATCG
jgi:dTDP-4-dehydrorhamnose reductase